MRLFQIIKNFLKKILPPPTRTLLRESERIIAAIAEGKAELQEIRRQLSSAQSELVKTEESFAEGKAELQEIRRQLSSAQSELVKTEESLGRLHEEQSEILLNLNSLHADLSILMNEHSLIQGELSSLKGCQEATQTILLSASEDQKAIEATLFLASEERRAIQSSLSNSLTENKNILINQIKPQTVISSRNAAETIWAEVFNNTITNSKWLTDKTFSPGRWAAGYQMLYAMYRVLDEMHPKSILELGLGQSTRMISQYASKFDDVQHTVVEHDGEWISFFENSYAVPDNTNIVQLEREFVPYKEAEAVRVFKDFAETFEAKKFDFIVIDAPLGGDMKQYARIDVLSIIPQSLCESFVIILDDTERSGESRTAKEIENLLRENEIEYVRGNYSGRKDTVLICNKKNAFLATL